MTAPAFHGTRQASREFIAEMLAMVRIQAELGETHAEIGDDTALTYAMRRLVAHTRTALGALVDMKEETKRAQGGEHGV